MLIACTECQQQISDKAIFCPHCGLPLERFSEKSHPGKNRKRFRLPNGFGRITKIKGRLKRPYRVMVTVGKDKNGKPIGRLLQPNAYFSTYNDAYQALVEYNRDPYDLRIMTLEDVYNLWNEQYFLTVSDSSKKRALAAWKYCEMIRGMNIREIRIRHLKKCLEEGYKVKHGEKLYLPDGMKRPVKTLLNQLFQYAVENEYVAQNIVKDVTMSKIESKPEPAHNAYSPEELEVLWSKAGNPLADFTLIQCYSGFRPGELLAIKKNNICLEDHLMVGGLKTKAGINRIVPIHPKIKPIIERYLQIGNEDTLIYNISYKPFYKLFVKEMPNIIGNTSHKPHDGRKTFATLAKRNNLDEYAIKHIMGHTISDITESVYTERDPEWLYQEVCKI